jgi:hypothetical protein
MVGREAGPERGTYTVQKVVLWILALLVVGGTFGVLASLGP